MKRRGTLIRRHLMRGKNQLKFLPAKQPGIASSAIRVNPHYSPQAVPHDQWIKTCYSYIPKRVVSNLSFINIAAEITPAIFGDVLQCLSPSLFC